MEEKSMTGEEVMKQLLSALNGNGMQQTANGVYELCAYVDSMTHKVEDMTEEIAKLRDDIQRMQDDTVTNKLKKSLNEAADRLENRCNQIKDQLFEVKEDIKHKTGGVVADFKMRGKEALNRVCEFTGLKEKLMGIRNKVKEGITDTEHTISKIDEFGKGMREAGQKVVNTFRTFADKEEVYYSEKEKRFSKTEVMKKPWKWQKKVYESMVIRLDASIDKVENLARDVEINRMKDKQVDKEKQTEEVMEDVSLVSAVAEPSEYQYGAEAFEAACAKGEQAKVSEVKVPDVPKQGKSR